MKKLADLHKPEKEFHVDALVYLKLQTFRQLY